MAVGVPPYPKAYYEYKPIQDYYIPSYTGGVYITPAPEYYEVSPPTQTWVFKRIYTNSETGQTVEVVVYPDGTVHLSQDAFDELMRDKGFKAAGGTIGQS
jgi:hypothetical protein